MLNEYSVRVTAGGVTFAFIALGFTEEAVKNSTEAKYPFAVITVSVYKAEIDLEQQSAKLFSNPSIALKWIAAKRYVINRGLTPYRHMPMAGRIVEARAPH